MIKDEIRNLCDVLADAGRGIEEAWSRERLRRVEDYLDEVTEAVVKLRGLVGEVRAEAALYEEARAADEA